MNFRRAVLRTVFFFFVSTGAQQTQLTELKLLWRRDKIAAGTVDISIREDQQSQPGNKLETLASVDLGLSPVAKWMLAQLSHIRVSPTRHWWRYSNCACF